MPLVLAALIANQTISIEQSGWVAASAVLGGIVSTLLLPMLRIEKFSRLQLSAPAVLVVIGLLVSTNGGYSFLLLGWFVIGFSLGGLVYAGTIVAAQYKDPAVGFFVRFGLILLCSGIFILVLQLGGAAVTYDQLVQYSAVLLPVMIVLCVIAYQPASRSTAEAVNKSVVEPFRASHIVSILISFMFFAGLTGVLAYAVHNAKLGELSIAYAITFYAVAKLAAGILLLVSALRNWNFVRAPLYLLSCLSCVSFILLTGSYGLWIFGFGIFLFEVAGLALVSRYQAGFLRQQGQSIARWLTLAQRLGAAVGSPLHAAALGIDSGYLFTAFALFAALLPAIWLSRQASR